MSETPIYDQALALIDELDRLSNSGVSSQMIRERAVVTAILAVAEALHRARDTLAGSTDERSENG